MNIDEVRKRHFPRLLKSGFSVEIATREVTRAFMDDHFQDVFGVSPTQMGYHPPIERADKIRALNKNYQLLHHEHFLFKDENGRPVGWFTGEAEDTITFYNRNAGVLPEVRNQAIATEFLGHFIDYLRELGYERVTSQHKVTNKKVLLALLKRDFIITSLEATERWGIMVKLTRFLHEDRLQAFIEKYGDSSHLEFFKD